MKRRISTLISIVSLSLMWSGATGLGVVREFQGTGSTMTPEFHVRAPWLLDWRVNGEYSKVLGLEIDLMDAKTGMHVGRILKTKRVGNGVKLFNESGRYKLRIDSSLARWQIKIQEISREDAKRYTPRNGG